MAHSLQHRLYSSRIVQHFGDSFGVTMLYQRVEHIPKSLIILVSVDAAIGMGVVNIYHEGSKAALGAQGTLNSIAAGILLYNGIADLIIPGMSGTY